MKLTFPKLMLQYDQSIYLLKSGRKKLFSMDIYNIHTYIDFLLYLCIGSVFLSLKTLSVSTLVYDGYVPCLKAECMLYIRKVLA